MSGTQPARAIATETVIEAQGLGKAFGKEVLFDDANMAIHQGETFTIIGESGSGKSVLLKMFIGLLDPDAGKILFKGEDVVEMEQEGLDRVRRQVGYVFQNDALFDSMTISENVSYALKEHTDASDEQQRERVIECLKMVGLDPDNYAGIEEQFPANLSGGMRKRVGIARAIAHEPEVLLYDEPTQGLDPQNITRIAGMIASLQRELRVTSVVVTHDMRTAFSISDRIAMLHEKHFPYQGTPRELAHLDAKPVREYIKDALEELREAGIEL